MTLDPSQHPDWPGLRDELRSAWAAAGGGPLERSALVGAIVEQGCPGAWSEPLVAGVSPDLPPSLAVPEIAGLALEALIDAADRRRYGAHHTPPLIASRLVDLALAGGSPSTAGIPSCLDPAVGGGAFLLAAARALVRRGHGVAEVLGSLHGCDLDPLAVAVTRASLHWWARETQLASEPELPLWPSTDGLRDRIRVDDGLTVTRATWTRKAGFDLVIGNPPFLSQLAASTARSVEERARAAERFGVDGYADSAGLFVLAATELAADGGQVMLIQPESFLAAKDAGPLRDRLLESARLSDLWVAVDRVFEAGVRVCAPVFTVMSPEPMGVDLGERPRVTLWRGAEVCGAGSVVPPEPGRTWGNMVATLHGTPAAHLHGRGRLGDLATTTAGFRDQFYGLSPHVTDVSPDSGSAPPRGALVTVGSIDPMCCRWGTKPVRFAGGRWLRPVIDLDGLAQANPALYRWVTDRLVPKVLVATQTRVIEGVPDPQGRLVPSVPVIAVAGRPEQVWELAAVLLAPPVSAWALHHAGGAALAADAVKLSASQVLDIALPARTDRWQAAAELLRSETGSAAEFAELMTAAYGLDTDHEVVQWWLARLPSWRGIPTPRRPATT